MHLPILNRSTWDGPIDLNDGVLHELKFWIDNIDTLPFRTLAPIDRTPDRIAFTDASSFAGAAVTLESVNKVVHCMFSEQEIRESSTFRELKAVQFAIESLKATLSGKFVTLYTDNQNVVRIVSVGSMKNKLTKYCSFHFQIVHRFKYNVRGSMDT